MKILLIVSLALGLTACEPHREVPPARPPLTGDGAPAGVLQASVAFDTTRQRLVLFGGASGSRSGPDGDRFSGETWILEGDRWTRTATTGPTPRTAAAVAYDPDRDRIVLFGGIGNSWQMFGDTWSFDGTRWTELELATTPEPAWGARMVFDTGRRELLMFGGEDGLGWQRGVYALTEEGWVQRW